MSRPKCHTLTDADDTVGYDDTIRDWARRTWTGLKDRNTCRSQKRAPWHNSFTWNSQSHSETKWNARVR